MAYTASSYETIFITHYTTIPEWDPANNETTGHNFFITNDHQETNLILSLKKCITTSYASNIIKENDNTYKVAIYKNNFETVFTVILYRVTYDSLLHLLDNKRLCNINPTDTDLKNILLLDLRYDYGDLITYHECFRYVKNNYENSIEKSDRVCYTQDLMIYQPRKRIVLKYNSNNPNHIPIIISLFYTNRKIGIEQFKIMHKINMYGIDNPIIRYQFLILMINFFSFEKIKYENISTKDNINNIIFYLKLKLTLYNIGFVEDVSKKYINAYKSLCHTYIDRFMLENIKNIFRRSHT
jgi:hypothetical protein